VHHVEFFVIAFTNNAVNIFSFGVADSSASAAEEGKRDNYSDNQHYSSGTRSCVEVSFNSNHATDLRGTDSDVFVPPPSRWGAHTLAVELGLKSLNNGKETLSGGFVSFTFCYSNFSGSFFTVLVSRVVLFGFRDAGFLDGLLGAFNVDGFHAFIKVFDLTIESVASKIFLFLSAELGVSNSIFSENSFGFSRVGAIIDDLCARAFLFAHNEER